ncbi:hypothetical protein HHI36_007826 [Cryptolaemus montrouzieri]|uniref:Uncharacterized protein n=1 Tax=Cryptolaemus montrouzieri TaxID=559131 RepID=A0ABD2MQS8_9CUCU
MNSIIFPEMFNTDEEKTNGEQRFIDEKLLEMTSKILNMRKKLDSVNLRFAFVRHELTDQHEYIAKLAKIKETLEEQEDILKRQVIDIAQRVIRRRYISRRSRQSLNNNSLRNSESLMSNQQAFSDMNMQKCQKEKLNKMLKLKDEIENMREYEQYQTKKLNELQKIKQIIAKLSADDNNE